MWPTLLLPRPRGCHIDGPSAAGRSGGPGCVMHTGHPWWCRQQGGFVAKPSQAPPRNPVLGRAERSRPACHAAGSASPVLCPSRGLAQLFPPVRRCITAPLLPPWVLGVVLPVGMATQPGMGSRGGVGRRAAWQEAFLTPGLCLWRTFELSRCTAVILVLALSSWAGSPSSGLVLEGSQAACGRNGLQG